MSVDIPNPMGINLDVLGDVPVALDVTHLPTIEIGKIQVGLDKIQLGIDPLNVTLAPISLSVAITQVPNLRVHVPAQFKVGLRVFGFEMASVDLCGEAQVIVEPYRPNPAERCCDDDRFDYHAQVEINEQVVSSK